MQHWNIVYIELRWQTILATSKMWQVVIHTQTHRGRERERNTREYIINIYGELPQVYYERKCVIE